MIFAEILPPERVAIDIVAASKKRALEEVATLLASSSPDIALADVLSSLTNREKLGSTGLGHGVAIPHGRLGGIESSVCAMVRLRNPVDYEAHDNLPVDLVIGLLVPQNATSDHLQHLAAIAEKFSVETFCESARSAPDALALHRLLVQ